MTLLLATLHGHSTVFGLPESIWLNLGLFKQVPLGSLREGARLEYRVEFFNAFNRTHFRAPDTTFEGGSFGRISELLRGPREIQMALKFYW